MTTDEKFMHRCLQLARCGNGRVAPNPMVGAVIVRNGVIIGEGYHRLYGEAHAEVNAFDSVQDKSLIAGSEMYVSLEPCSHFGKTPPCANRLVKEGIKRVVIAMEDPNPQVSGRGVKILQDAGIEVVIGVLEQQALYLNRAFVKHQRQRQPYVHLKWAQTRDGFIDKIRTASEQGLSTPISSDFRKVEVHKLRAETMAIMVGTNTAIADNPQLTTRLWHGKNPIRIVLDKNRRIPDSCQLFDHSVRTLVYTQSVEKEVLSGNNLFVPISFDESLLVNILDDLGRRNINSLLVEGGAQLLQSFIDQQLWDEACVEVANVEFKDGVKAPHIQGELKDIQIDTYSSVLHYLPYVTSI